MDAGPRGFSHSFTKYKFECSLRLFTMKLPKMNETKVNDIHTQHKCCETLKRKSSNPRVVSIGNIDCLVRASVCTTNVNLITLFQSFGTIHSLNLNHYAKCVCNRRGDRRIIAGPKIKLIFILFFVSLAIHNLGPHRVNDERKK